MEIIKSSNELFQSHIVVYDGESYILCEALHDNEKPSLDDMLFFDEGRYYRAVIATSFNPLELAEGAA